MSEEERIRAIETDQLLDLKHTIAASLFREVQYPYEALPKIGDHIKKLGESLS